MEVVNGFDTKNVLGSFGTKKDLVGGLITIKNHWLTKTESFVSVLME